MIKCTELKNLIYTDTEGKRQELKEAYLFADGALFDVYRQDWHIYYTRIDYREINSDTNMKPQWIGNHNGEKVKDLYDPKDLNLDLYEITEDLNLALEY